MAAACNYSIPQSDCILDTCCLEQATVDYVVNIAGNAVYLAIFSLLLLIQLGLGIPYHTWGFLIGRSCGTILEILGYDDRLNMRNNPFDFHSFLQ